ncbi:hypothetical protein F4678DRAFT_462494 [Xylaria arbuscula]|nr:hypothetical protein F4678DRAFT_462494 [Xylaria arbuscula]
MMLDCLFRRSLKYQDAGDEKEALLELKMCGKATGGDGELKNNGWVLKVSAVDPPIRYRISDELQLSDIINLSWASLHFRNSLVLTIFRVIKITNCPIQGLSNVRQIAERFAPYVRKLNFAGYTHFEGHIGDYCFQHATKLKSLVLIVNEETPFGYDTRDKCTLPLRTGTHIPDLRHLQLREMFISRELVDFILGPSTKLRVLELHNCHTESRWEDSALTWAEFFQPLDTDRLKLEKLTVQYDNEMKEINRGFPPRPSQLTVRSWQRMQEDAR